MSQASLIAGDSPSMAELVDELTARLKRGEAVDLPSYQAAHPEHAAELQQLYPALQLLADFSQSGSASVPAPVEEADALLPLGELGDYQLVRELGRGGMGIVYEAEQRSLRRRVALKVLPFAGALDARRLQRFQNEAQAAASLHHPNIVPVHGVGCERAVHFYAMQYIEGQSLAAILRELRRNAGLAGDDEEEPAAPRKAPEPQPGDEQALTTPYVPPAAKPPASAETAPRAGLSTEQSIQSRGYIRSVAALGIQAAEALEHAHETGVVHRDIKPANLLVDSRGKLWVTDFGLAQCKQQAGLTMSGDLLGTLRYMSPEQALAQRVAIDHRTDVYSLGATLYELLTLRPVFAGSNRQELLRQIAFEEPRPPRQHNKAIPPELETVVLKALEKNPADRYATAQALAEDLRRFLEDKPIRACRPRALQRLRKWSRRHRTVVATVLVVGGLAVFGLVLGLVWHNHQLGQAAERERGLARDAQEEKERVEALNRFLLEDLLGQASPAENARQKKLTVEEALDKAAAKVDRSFPARPDLEATVRVAIGYAYFELGLYDRAQPQLEQALVLNRGRLGSDHPDTLAAATRLARVLISREKLAEAEPLCRQNLEASRRVHGRDHPITMIAMNDLACLLRTQGKLVEAESFFRQGLNDSRRVLGPEHPETLISVNNLATVLEDQGKLAESGPLVHQNLEAMRRVLGPNDPRTLRSVNNLANTLLHQGKLTEAEGLLRQALEDCRRVFGPDHPETLSVMHNLAFNLHAQRKLTEAESLHRQNLDVCNRMPVPHEPRRLDTMNCLAQVLFEQGKLAEAESIARQSVVAHRQFRGAEHAATLRATNRLAALLQEQGKLAEAEPLMRQHLKAQCRAQGPEHPNTLQAENHLAVLPREVGKAAEAETLFRHNFEACRRVQGPDHADTLLAMINLAAPLQDQGKLAEAEALAREALDRARRAPAHADPSLAGCLRRLGDILVDSGRAAEAEPLLRQALDLFGKALPPGHLMRATTESMLGGSLAGQKKYAEAEPSLLAGYRDLDKVEATYPLQCARAGARLVQLYEAWGKKEQADAWRKKLPAGNRPPTKGASAKDTGLPRTRDQAPH